MKNETVSLENLEVGQSTPQEVYAFIEEDLIFAKNNLEATQGGGRATKGAAQALLGKVYLQMTGHPINDASYFAKAENELKDVIDSNVYSLVPYYPDIFTQDNEQNNEIIFSFGFANFVMTRSPFFILFLKVFSFLALRCCGRIIKKNMIPNIISKKGS